MISPAGCLAIDEGWDDLPWVEKSSKKVGGGDKDFSVKRV